MIMFTNHEIANKIIKVDVYLLIYFKLNSFFYVHDLDLYDDRSGLKICYGV